MGDYPYIKTGECYSKHSHCLFYGELNMFKLSDRVRVVFAPLGASSILVSMYLIPFIKTENKFWGNTFIYIRCIANWNCVTKSPKKLNFGNRISE